MPDLTTALAGNNVDVVIVLEIYAWNLKTDQTQQLVFASERIWQARTFLGRVDVTEARISGAPTWEANLFGRNGEVGGVSLPEFGQITLDNKDDKLNYLSGFNFEGAVFFWFIDTPERLQQFRIVAGTGKIKQAKFGDSFIKFSVRDRTESARAVNIPAERFGADFNGVSVDADVQGRVIPIGLGDCWGHRTWVKINSAHLIGMVHNGPITVTSVLEYLPANPEPWQYYAFSGDFADVAALQAADVPGGHYATCESLGLIRLGSGTGDVRVNWTGRAANGDTVGTHAALFSWVAQQIGAPANATMMDAHAVERPEPACLVIRDAVNGWDLLGQLAYSSNSYMTTPDGSSPYLAPLESPGATATWVIDCDDPTLNAKLTDPTLIQPHTEVIGRHESAYEGIQAVYRSPALSLQGWPDATEFPERPFFYRDGAGTSAAVNRWGEFLGHGRRRWSLRFEWHGQNYQIGQTVEITCPNWGLDSVIMTISGVRHTHPVPSGATVDHAYPIDLTLYEEVS